MDIQSISQSSINLKQDLIGESYFRKLEKNFKELIFNVLYLILKNYENSFIFTLICIIIQFLQNFLYPFDNQVI